MIQEHTTLFYKDAANRGDMTKRTFEDVLECETERCVDYSKSEIIGKLNELRTMAMEY